jgi:predicted nucleic acid-binding protein
VKFVETSVLIAAYQDFHEDHARCFQLVASMEPKSGCTSVHCLTELFSVTTRMPPKFRASPELGLRFVRQTEGLLTVLSLDAAESVRAIKALADRGLGGGMVYDALIVAAARKKKAGVIYTLNKRHFDAVAPDLASIIREP